MVEAASLEEAKVGVGEEGVASVEERGGAETGVSSCEGEGFASSLSSTAIVKEEKRGGNGTG
jgi:hypothetical protein